MQGDILDNDDDKEDDNNDDNNDDNHFGMEYNATVYGGRENSVAAVHQTRLSASPSSANVAASIAPDLSTDFCTPIASFAAAINPFLEREEGSL